MKRADRRQQALTDESCLQGMLDGSMNKYLWFTYDDEILAFPYTKEERVLTDRSYLL